MAKDDDISHYSGALRWLQEVAGTHGPQQTVLYIKFYEAEPVSLW